MFIKESVFKNMVKQAYSSGTLEVGNQNGWYTVSSNYWTLEVRCMFLTNKIKSILIELIGEMPEYGQTIRYRKGTEPELQEDPNYWDLQAYYSRTEDEYEYTNISMQSDGVEEVVLQETTTLEKILINSVFPAMVDKSKVETEKGETLPGKPRGIAGYNTLCWSNNVSSLLCYKRVPRYEKEKRLLNLIEKENMKWYGTKEELIHEVEEDTEEDE